LKTGSLRWKRLTFEACGVGNIGRKINRQFGRREMRQKTRLEKQQTRQPIPPPWLSAAPLSRPMVRAVGFF